MVKKSRVSTGTLIIGSLLAVALLTSLMLAQGKSNQNDGVAKNPVSDSKSVFIPPVNPAAETIDLEEARSRAKYKLREPDASILPADAKLTKVLVQPQAAGEGYCLFYGDEIELAMDPTNIPMDIEEELALTYKPDLAKPNNRLPLYKRFEINGIPAIGHNPTEQIMRDGVINHVPGVLIWQEPGANGIKYIRYTLYGENLPVSELLKIAKSLK
ncbi:MAG: hypothetical protein IBX64_11445 [Actinobacteria bacterium]|nr:hypothetical protein [Actinomycetota bacterium]